MPSGENEGAATGVDEKSATASAATAIYRSRRVESGALPFTARDNPAGE